MLLVSNKEMTQNKRNFKERFIEMLREEPANWKKNLTTNGSPVNLISERAYSGFNLFLLQEKMGKLHSNDPRFVTFNQANDAGYMVQKNAKSVCIEYYTYCNCKTKEPILLKDLAKERAKLPAGIIKGTPHPAYLFNITELERGDRAPYHPKKMNTEAILQKMADSIDLPVIFSNVSEPCYNVDKDLLLLPKCDTDKNLLLFPKTDTEDKEVYFTKFLLAICEATGYKGRCEKRFPYEKDKKMLTKEHFIIDLASCILCSALRLKNNIMLSDPEDVLTYILWDESFFREALVAATKTVNKLLCLPDLAEELIISKTLVERETM